MLKCETSQFKYTIYQQMFSTEVKTFYCKPIYLWEHIENHTKEAFIGVHEKNKNQKKLDELNAEKPWQVVDINFGTSDNKEQELLTKMD